MLNKTLTNIKSSRNIHLVLYNTKRAITEFELKHLGYFPHYVV